MSGCEASELGELTFACCICFVNFGQKTKKITKQIQTLYSSSQSSQVHRAVFRGFHDVLDVKMGLEAEKDDKKRPDNLKTVNIMNICVYLCRLRGKFPSR